MNGRIRIAPTDNIAISLTPEFNIIIEDGLLGGRNLFLQVPSIFTTKLNYSIHNTHW